MNNIKTFPAEVPAPAFGMSISTNFNVNQISFGDGYEQTSPRGLNNVRDNVDATFNNISERHANIIVNFIKSLKGAEPFLYEIDGEIKIYRCTDLSVTKTAPNRRTVQLTMRETFR